MVSSGVAQVEDVVELRRRREHLLLHAAPQGDGDLRQLAHDLQQLGVQAGGTGEATAEHLTVDVVDAGDAGKHHVEEVEVALESVGDVVAPAAGMDHGRHVLQVLADLEVAALVLVQEAEAVELHDEAHHLQRGLVAPGVLLGHAQVVDEHRHLLAARRAEGLAAALVQLHLDAVLAHEGRGGAGEVHLLHHHLRGVQRLEEHGRRGRLCRTGRAHQQHRRALALLVHVLEDVERARGVHGGHQEVGEVQLVAAWVVPLRRHHLAPVAALGVDVVLEDGVALLLQLGQRRRVDVAQVRVKLLPVLVLQQPSDRPAQREEEEPLEVQLQVSTVVGGATLAGHEAGQEIAEAADLAHAHHLHDFLGVAKQHVHGVPGVERRGLAHPLLHQLAEDGLLLRGALADVGLHDGAPVQVGLGHVDDACARDRRRTGVDQRLHLEHELHVVRHGDPVSVGDGQQLVVVQHGVEVFDPDGVHRAIADDPRVVRMLARIHLSVHLLRADGLGVQARVLVLDAHGLLERLAQVAEDLRLAAARRAHQHDAVAHERDLVQLDQLAHPVAVVHELVAGHDLLQLGLQPGVGALGRRVIAEAGEQVLQQGEEQRHVLRYQLTEVHVSERAVHEEGFGLFQVVALGLPRSAQHREDVAEAPVVVLLRGQLLLGRVVQHEELLRQQVELRVAHAAELDLHDDLEVGHHHGHAAEQRLEVLRQLLPAGVAGVHRDEEAAHGLQHDVLRVARELEGGHAGLLGVLDRQHLLRHHAEHGQQDAIELVEAAPKPRLAKTLEDLAAVGVSHLIRAVGHHDVDAQRAPQILHRLRLARPRRPGGSAAKVLELVLEVHVGDGDDGGAVGVHVVGGIGAVVEARLLEPLEVVGVRDALGAEQPIEVVADVPLMHVDGDERLDLLAVHFRPQVLQAPRRQLSQHAELPLLHLFHGVLLDPALFQRLLNVRRPEQLDAKQRELRDGAVHVSSQRRHLAGHAVDLRGAAAADLAQPVLDVPLRFHRRREGNDFVAFPPIAVDAADDVLVALVVLHVADGVKDLFVVGVHGQRVGALRQDDEQRGVRHEVEARELVLLLLQVALEGALAALQLGVHHGQRRLEHLVAAALHDVAGLEGLLHDLHPVLVHLGELLGLHGHLLHDVAAREHALQRRPHLLHLHPALERIRGVRQQLQQFLQVLAERDAVAHSDHRLQVQLRLLELLHHRAVGLDGVYRSILPRREHEAALLPDRLDLQQAVLDLQLLVRRVRHLLDLLGEALHLDVQERLQLELSVQVELRLGDAHDFLPVAPHDGRLAELLQQRQDDLEILDGLLEVQVSFPFPQALGHLLAAAAEGFHLVGPVADVGLDLRPAHFPPLVQRVDHVDVQGEQAVAELHVLLRLVQQGILGMRQGEQLFAAAVELVLLLAQEELFLEALEALVGLSGVDASGARPVVQELLAEHHDVLGEVLDVAQQVPLEGVLRQTELGGAAPGLLDQALPVGAQNGLLVDLLLRHEALGQVEIQQAIHVHHRLDLHVDARLALADLLEQRHDPAQRVQVVDLVVQLPGGGADVLGELLQLLARLDVQVVAELELPLVGVLLELLLEVVGVEAEGADVVDAVDGVDLALHVSKVPQPTFVILQRRPLVQERLVRLVLVVLPDPVILGERLQVLAHRVADALHTARKQQCHTHDLDILRDALEERSLWPRGGARGAAGVPVLHRLEAPEDRLRRLVDALLDAVQGRVEHDLGRRQMDVHLEEGHLKEEEARAGAGADAALQRVHGGLAAVQQRLIDEVVVVLLELVDLPFQHALDVRVQRVRLDDVHEVLHGMLHLDVLALEQQRHVGDVRFLHAHELVDAEGLVLRQVHQQRLRDGLEVLLDAVLDDVVGVLHQLVQLLQAVVDVGLVRVDVHGRPGQRDHTGPQAILHVVEVGPQHHGRDGNHLRDDAVVLGERPVQVVVVLLELLLLEQRDLGALRYVDSHAVQALGLADELENLLVEVHVQLAVIGVADDERRLQARLGLLDALDPGLVPEVLERHQRPRHLVVRLNDPLGVLAGQHVLVGLELLHGLLDALQQVSRPRDVAADRRQVPRDGRVVLLLLIELLDLLQLLAVVEEDDVELGVQVALERLALQDGLELVQQLEAVLDGRDVLEALVDELLEAALQVADLHVELDVVAVELVVVVVQQVVAAQLEVLDDRVEHVDELLDAFQLVLAQRAELVDGAEHVDELDDAAAEEIELAEDLVGLEVELLALRVLLQLALGQPVLLLIRLVELEARLQLPHQILRVLLPQRLHVLPARDGVLAVADDLIRDLGEQLGHPLVRVVVPGDGVDHLDGVHERRQRIDDAEWRAAVQRLDEALEREEVLDVVLGLVGRLGDVDVDLLPAPQQRDDLLLGRVGRVLGEGGQHGDDGLAVRPLHLLGDGREALHPIAPVLQLSARPHVVQQLGFRAAERRVEVLLDLVAPLLQQLLELRDHLGLR
eukprot:scaffold486_cov254-Pinguiococcus_pyrenoidosus.AAC.1